jgi:hypothetical protein
MRFSNWLLMTVAFLLLLAAAWLLFNFYTPSTV